MPALGFRADIEGLRAVCVLAVVAYHAGFSSFSGGFIGVDAFFVISGFLITSLLLKELDQTGRIDLPAFWARRARRLLPNSLLTVSAVLLVTILVAPPSMKVEVWQDALSVLLYLSNFFFAHRTVDYFDESVQSSPLLHFWSLSLEEQFYIVWPLIIAAVVITRVRNPRRTALILLILLTLGSFAASLIWITRNQPSAFFHAESRFWQLGAGSLLAFGFLHVSRLPRALLAGLAWLGLAGLLAGIVLYSDKLIYPGLWALLPTLSTLALLAGGNAGPAAPAVLLGVSPMTWLGRLSYSIYLWHWPILIFAPRLLNSGPEEPQWLSLALILPIAAAAYYLVENPIRRADWSKLRPRATLAVAAGATASVAAMAFVIPGIVLRDMGDSEIERLALKAHDDRSQEYSGFCRQNFDNPQRMSCIFGTKSSNKRVVLFGDSHAAHLFSALEEAARSKDWALVMYYKASCPPIDVDVYNRFKKTLDHGCIEWREKAIRRIIADRPDLLVISSWTGWSKKMFRGEEGLRLTSEDSRRVYVEGFRTILKRFKDAGLNVTVVRGTPRNRRDGVADCIIENGPQNCGTARREAVDQDSPEVEAAGQVGGIGILDLTDRFCGKNVCQAVIDGMVVYRDSTHITSTFARSLAPAFAEVLD